MTQRLTNALNYLTDELRRSRRGNLDSYSGSDDDDPPMDAIEVETEHSGADSYEDLHEECVDHDGGCDYQEDHDAHDSEGYDAYDSHGDGESGDSDYGDNDD